MLSIGIQLYFEENLYGELKGERRRKRFDLLKRIQSLSDEFNDIRGLDSEIAILIRNRQSIIISKGLGFNFSDIVKFKKEFNERLLENYQNQFQEMKQELESYTKRYPNEIWCIFNNSTRDLVEIGQLGQLTHSNEWGPYIELPYRIPYTMTCSGNQELLIANPDRIAESLQIGKGKIFVVSHLCEVLFVRGRELLTDIKMYFQ